MKRPRKDTRDALFVRAMMHIRAGMSMEAAIERAAQDMQEALINWKQEMAEAAARQRPH